MSMTETGNIIRIDDTEAITDTFSKRLCVLETEDGKYKQPLPMEFCNDKCALLDAFAVGDEVTVTFDLRGRFWSKGDRYFLSASAWKISALDASQNESAASDQPNGAELPPEDDNLPF
jgi:single-strand DNA-binding protein